MLVLGLIIGFVVGVLTTFGLAKLCIRKKVGRGYCILAESEYGDRAVGVKFNDPDSLDKKAFVILKIRRDTLK